MAESVKVNLLIESFINEEPAITQEAQGDLYFKGSHYYLRYKEPDPEMEGTATLIKLEAGLVRIIRQGHVRSEQTFKAGQRLNGYYEAPQGKLVLEADTAHLTMELEQGLGVIEWAYTLFVSEEKAGDYRIRLKIFI